MPNLLQKIKEAITGKHNGSNQSPSVPKVSASNPHSTRKEELVAAVAEMKAQSEKIKELQASVKSMPVLMSKEQKDIYEKRLGQLNSARAGSGKNPLNEHEKIILQKAIVRKHPGGGVKPKMGM